MTLRLWNSDAPGALGQTESDIPTLSPFIPEQRKGEPTGAVIVCPGGGYEFLAEHEGDPVAQWLQRNGVAAFVLRYRVAPYRDPIPATDLRRAIRTVRRRHSEWNVDPLRIGALGFSAGGHLASMVGTHFDEGIVRSVEPVDAVSCRPDCLILCYPVISFVRYAPVGSRVHLIGDERDFRRLRELSSELNVRKDGPPSFLWHCSDDDAVPVENSLLFAAALSEKGIPFELHVFERGGHGAGLAEKDPSLRVWPELCMNWLRGMGW